MRRPLRALFAAPHCRPTSTGPTPAPALGARLARLSLPTHDAPGVTSFFVGALGFRAAPGPSGTRLGDGAGLGLEVLLVPHSPGGAPPQPPFLPYLTVAVSNLATACRRAGRAGGSVVSGGGAGATRAVLASPDGARLVAVHAFRRSPVLSVSFGVGGASPPALAATYAALFGMLLDLEGRR